FRRSLEIEGHAGIQPGLGAVGPGDDGLVPNQLPVAVGEVDTEIEPLGEIVNRLEGLETTVLAFPQIVEEAEHLVTTRGNDGDDFSRPGQPSEFLSQAIGDSVES